MSPLMIILHFHSFSVPGGALGVPGGSLEVLGSFRGFLVGPRDVLGDAWWLLWGSFGGPGAVLVKPWAVTLALLGESWGSLGGPGGFLGRPCGRPSTTDVTLTEVSASRMFSCFSTHFFCFSNIMFIFLCFCPRHAGPGAVLGKPCRSPGHP